MKISTEVTNPRIEVCTPAYLQDPFPTLNWLRENRPIYPVHLQNTNFRVWLVTRYDDVRALLMDRRLLVNFNETAESTRSCDPSLAETSYNDVLGLQNPPDHIGLRKFVAEVFSQRQIASWRPVVESKTEKLLDAIEVDNTVDLFNEFAAPLATSVFSEFMGFPGDYTRKLTQWFDILGSAELGKRAQRPAILKDMAEYTRELIESELRQPTGNLVSALAKGYSRGAFEISELTSLMLIMVLNGVASIPILITNGMLALFQHPDQKRLLEGEPSLIGSAVEEFLRFDGPLLHGPFRYPEEDMEIRDVVVPAGEPVSLAIASANRDATQFQNPETLDIKRHDAPHLSLGHGIHHCLGSALARLEAQVAISYLLRRFPNIELAVSRHELRYAPEIFIHKLQELPVRLRR